MTWKDDKDLGPWEFAKTGADNRYNEGNLIATSADPVWDLDSNTGVPITDGHDPCGYWTKDYTEPPEEVYAGRVYWFGVNGNDFDVHDGGDFDQAPLAELIPDISDWKVSKIFSSIHAIALKKDNGLVYTRGQNDYGQTGQGFVSVRWTGWGQPTVGKDIPDFWDAIYIAARHHIGITSDGKMYLCGYNGSGFLNTGVATNPLPTFTKDPNNSNWSLVGHSYGTGTAGARYAYGGTQYLNTTATPNITSNLVGAGSDGYTQFGCDCLSLYGNWQGITDGSPGNVVKLCGGNGIAYYGVGSTDSFEAYSAGNNGYGALGRGFFTSYEDLWGLVLGGPWKDFDCGSNHAVGIGVDGKLYGCGYGYRFTLGQGAGNTDNKHTMTLISSATNWVKCLGGPTQTYALNTDGEVWCCGWSGDNQCGMGYSRSVEELTREASNGTWHDIGKFGGGLILIRQE